MPSNKKKASQQKTGTKKSSNAEIANWAKKGCSPKKLSKKLPDVAQALRDGRLKPDEIPDMVKNATKNAALEAIQHHFPKLGPKVIRIQALELITKAETLLCDLVRFACGADEKLAIRFAHTFFHTKRMQDKWGNIRSTITMNGEEITALASLPLIVEVQQAFDNACEYHRVAIERLVNKKLEEHVFTWNDPILFTGLVANLIHRSENFRIDHLCEDMAHTKSFETDKKAKAAATAVHAGWDAARRQCWECREPNIHPFLQCSRCEAAGYCSAECQKKSWKGGHKCACDTLKTIYANFKANVNRIGLAQKQGFIAEGSVIRPGLRTEYTILPMLLMSNPIAPVIDYHAIDCGGGSIDHLYNNLVRISTGEKHWLFNDVFEGDVESFYSGMGSFQQHSPEELEYLRRGLLILAVDLSKVASLTSPSFFIQIARTKLQESAPLVGELMSAKRFVQVYCQLGKFYSHLDMNKSARLEYVAKSFQVMIKNFHKSPLSLNDLYQDLGPGSQV